MKFHGPLFKLKERSLRETNYLVLQYEKGSFEPAREASVRSFLLRSSVASKQQFCSHCRWCYTLSLLLLFDAR